MGRIKQGLDYFPLNTDFMHDRVVRRVMKREGDSVFTILLYTLSYLYSGEGYYIHVDDDFYDELSDQLFSTDNDSVRPGASSVCGVRFLRFLSLRTLRHPDFRRHSAAVPFYH